MTYGTYQGVHSALPRVACARECAGRQAAGQAARTSGALLLERVLHYRAQGVKNADEHHRVEQVDEERSPEHGVFRPVVRSHVRDEVPQTQERRRERCYSKGGNRVRYHVSYGLPDRAPPRAASCRQLRRWRRRLLRRSLALGLLAFFRHIVSSVLAAALGWG